MSSPEWSIAWIDGNVEGPESFDEYLHVLIGKTATSLKSIYIVTYSDHFVLMKCSASNRPKQLVIGHSVVGFSAVGQ